MQTGTEAGGSSGLGTHSPGQNLARQSFSSGRPDSLASLSMSHASNGIASGMYNRATDETVDLETSSNGLSLSEFEIRRPYPESDAASEYPRYDVRSGCKCRKPAVDLTTTVLISIAVWNLLC